MYQPMLFLHWKQARLFLAPLVVAAFGLPLLAIQGLGPAPGADLPFTEAYSSVAALSLWLPLFPLLAGAIGVTLGTTTWQWDHQHNHVYALSLPIARWEYVLLKMGAGLVLALMPAAAFWLGAHVAAASLTLPEGLRAYPNQLALRFLLAIVLSYALLFAMAAGTIRTTLWIVAGTVVLIAGLSIGGALLSLYVPSLGDLNLLDSVFNWMVRAGGPFGVFNGNWALIDV